MRRGGQFPILMSHWGLQVPWNKRHGRDAAMFAALHAARTPGRRRVPARSCFDGARDIVVPMAFRYGEGPLRNRSVRRLSPLDLASPTPVPADVPAGLMPAAEITEITAAPRTYECELFFAGSIDSWQTHSGAADMYSQGVRWAVQY